MIVAMWFATGENSVRATTACLAAGSSGAGGGIDYPWNGCRPLIAPHFNLTVELPLKAIVRGYSWAIIPITWRNRRSGRPKFRIREMGSRYLFICLYIWLEKYFSRGDYRRSSPADE